MTSITPEAAQEDLMQWLHWTQNTHPNLAYSTDLDALSQQSSAIEAKLSSISSFRDAWSTMALLNPVFEDAHIGLRLPDQAFEAYLDKGGRAFPADVTIRDGKLFMSEAEAENEIVAINGVSVPDILDWYQSRLRGEDSAIRDRILALKFPIAFWLYAGEYESFEALLRKSDGTTQTIELGYASAIASAPLFSVRFLDQIAFLTVQSFERSLETEFNAFLEEAFEEIAEQQATSLIIDIRQNGGGARELSNRLMQYLTETAFSPTSAVTARVVLENQSLIPDSHIGDVVTVPYPQTVTPDYSLDNRFTGEVIILIGPNTYSQAIVFAATAQDHGIATLVGTPTSGRANQTGQVQRKILSQSQFRVQSPIYIFLRQSGDSSGLTLQPDVLLEDISDDILEELIETRRGHSP